MAKTNAENQAKWRAAHPELARERRRECERRRPDVKLTRQLHPRNRDKKRARDRKRYWSLKAAREAASE